MRFRQILIGLLLIFLFISCADQADKAKFQKAEQASQAVKSAVTAGLPYDQVNAPLQKFSQEISDLKKRVKSDREKEILKAYTDLFDIYQDGLVLWNYKTEFKRYGFVPEGRIYAGQYADPIIAKYGIPIETHLYPQTGQKWKSVPADSIQGIWANADSQHKIIQGMLAAD